MNIYIDDNVHAGNKEFERKTLRSLEKFDFKPRVYDKFDFLGSVIETKGRGNFTLTQDRHLEWLAVLLKTCTFDMFRRIRAVIAWLANTRPGMCCLINRVVQVTEETFKKVKSTELNKAIKITKAKDNHGLTYGKLDAHTLRLKLYADPHSQLTTTCILNWNT